MRSRKASQQHVAEVARRRLEQLSAELAAIRPGPVESPVPAPMDGSGELPAAPGRTSLDADLWPDDPAVAEPPRRTSYADPERRSHVAADPGRPGRHAHRPLGVGSRLAGWWTDRLPAAAQDRFRLGRGHVLAVLVLVVAATAVTLWWLARADGGAETLPAVGPATPLVAGAGAPQDSPTGSLGAATSSTTAGAQGPASAGDAAATSASAPASGTIVVDVAGKVRHPGIATLPAGSRVADALRAAGGPRRGVGPGSLNLAQVLTDGEQVVVGATATGGGAAAAAGATPSPGSSATPMVDVNTATEAQLETLPDIGPVTAQAILDYRTENGSFASVDDLLDVSGIGDATLAKIAPYVTL